MIIHLVSPTPPGSRHGNSVTAARWTRLLGDLGHQVDWSTRWDGRTCDLLVALHARKSFPSIAAFRRARPHAPLIVALTGTDLYADLDRSDEAREAIATATRLVALQGEAWRRLPPEARPKLRIIYQSAEPPERRTPPDPDHFDVAVLSHLRPVKDPLRAAAAARLVPASSRLRVLHAGGALDEKLAADARAEMAANPRYRWLGELAHDEALALLARARLLVLTSALEGGANVVAEAVVAGVPVVSSRIDGSIGQLGADYPGFFPPGDARALADLLWRAETDAAFYDELASRCRAVRHRFDPAEERERWRALLAELAP
jgi:putative glycosyltransferase (TIGR04348 family)